MYARSRSRPTLIQPRQPITPLAPTESIRRLAPSHAMIPLQAVAGASGLLPFGDFRLHRAQGP
jgi:hypothetical protein